MKTYLPILTKYNVMDFEAEVNGMVDLKTNELSVLINFSGSDNTYIKVIKTTPQIAWKLANSANKDIDIYDEIMSDTERCTKFETWFAENILDDLIEECQRCCGSGTVIVGERCFAVVMTLEVEKILNVHDVRRWTGLKYELIN